MHLLAGRADGRAVGAALTPVVVASEMSPAALTWRSLARWTGHPAQYFRGGQTMARRSRRAEQESRAAWAAAQAALGGELGRGRDWTRLLHPERAGALAAAGARAFVEHLKRVVEAWREDICRAHPGRPVVPVVVVDPLQRYQAGDDEVSDLNALARELCAAAVAGGWIAMLTSDTNKVAATGGGEARADLEEGAAVFRGSYKLMHEVTTAIYLRRTARQGEPEPAGDERHVETVLVKNRWGASAPPWPRFLWQPATTRFYPQSRERAADLARTDAEAIARQPRAARRDAPPPAPPAPQRTRSDV